MFQDLKKESFLITLKLSLPLIFLSAIYLIPGIDALVRRGFEEAFSILVLGLIPFSFGLYRMVYALCGGYQRRVRQYIAGAPNPELTQSQMEQAYNATQKTARTCVTPAWTFIQKGPATYLYETQEILWVYELNRTVRHGLFLHFDYHYLMVGLANGQRLQFRMSEEQAEIAMDLFRIHAPFVVRGYLEPLATLFKRDLPEFTRLARSGQLQKDVVLDQNE
jgi:hypothetical protein